MTAKKKNQNKSVYESHPDIDHELNEEQEILIWRNCSPVVKTRMFIKSCSNSNSSFLDSDFLKQVTRWIEILLPYEDAFCGEHAETYWDTHCTDFLHKILDKENTPILEQIINDGAAQGCYTFPNAEGNELLQNFSCILWLLGLAEKPSIVTTEEETLKIKLINQGKLVFTQLKNQREVRSLVLTEKTEINYNLTYNNVTDNKGSNINIGASDSANVTQKIEQKEENK